MSKLIFQKSADGIDRRPYEALTQKTGLPPAFVRKSPASLPEVSEGEAVRHYINLSRKNFSVDTNFYPLGSCTMKYNPKILEKVSSMDEFSSVHPMMGIYGTNHIRGSLEVICLLQELLCEITGMARFSLQPLAGAHGELAGMLMVKKYHNHNGGTRKHVIVPDESHGTNPASAAMAGYDVVTVPTGDDGLLEWDLLEKNLNGDTAAVILTCPNTVGKFDPRIKKISALAHEKGALMYYDGANMNAILGKIRPGDLGFDIVHVNLHKTFGAPHGGGGPGSGPVGVTEELAPYLPYPVIERDKEGEASFGVETEKSIGKISPFYGNFGVYIKSLAYILLLGREGLTDVSEKAVLNANYLRTKLEGYFENPYPGRCMHETVFSSCGGSEEGSAMDLAKFLIDNGMHPPTVYFPLIVKEALMIDPAETETLRTLDRFIRVMRRASDLLKKNPSELKKRPVSTDIGRLDEVSAARDPDVSFCSD